MSSTSHLINSRAVRIAVASVFVGLVVLVVVLQVSSGNSSNEQGKDPSAFENVAPHTSINSGLDQTIHAEQVLVGACEEYLNCSGNGYCTPEGTCVCNASTWGDYCGDCNSTVSITQTRTGTSYDVHGVNTTSWFVTVTAGDLADLHNVFVSIVPAYSYHTTISVTGIDATDGNLTLFTLPSSHYDGQGFLRHGYSFVFSYVTFGNSSAIISISNITNACSAPVNATVPPTGSPTASPTAAPTSVPTAAPTAAPTAGPTTAPTATPTDPPTAAPGSPTQAPTPSPTPSCPACPKRPTHPVKRHIPGDNVCPAVVDERAILVEFYNEFNGKSWTNNQNWLQGSPCDGWFGIACNQNGNVVNIDLHNNSLRGNQIPPTIGCLSFLKALVLDDNFIYGQFPKSLCKLSNTLQYLTVSDNYLGGSIPACFSGFTFLEEFYIQNNGLTGKLPSFANYFFLKELRAANNCLIGEVPQTIPSQVIIDLDFYGNYLSGCIPDVPYKDVYFSAGFVDFRQNEFCYDFGLPCWLDESELSCPADLPPRHEEQGPFAWCPNSECQNVF